MIFFLSSTTLTSSSQAVSADEPKHLKRKLSEQSKVKKFCVTFYEPATERLPDIDLTFFHFDWLY